MIIAFSYAGDDGDEIEAELPARHEVCSRCEGHGAHLTPSIGEHAYSREEFEESFDEEEAEEYFRRGGRYDVTCEDCGGKRVIVVPDESACRSPEQKALFKAYSDAERDRAQDEADDRATMRGENGWRE